MYTKQPKRYHDLVQLLESRGLSFSDPNSAEAFIRDVNYYRLTAYLLPFKHNDELYDEGTSFEQVRALYNFDSRLRSILFRGLECVEISFRSRLANFHSLKHGPLGYKDHKNFFNSQRHSTFLSKLDSEITANANLPFVKHHNTKYNGEFPLWVAVELFTFGVTSKLYSNMVVVDQKDFSDLYYGKESPKNIKSWIKCCHDLRNICAHYGRLYYALFTSVPSGRLVERQYENSLWANVKAMEKLYPNQDDFKLLLVEILNLIEEYKEFVNVEFLGISSEEFDCLKSIK